LIDRHDVALDAFDGFGDVVEVVRQALAVVAHSGIACDSTDARNFTGSAICVSTSTRTPSSADSSCRMAPMSNRVVSGVGCVVLGHDLADREAV
jgi:hypothetical protein